MSKIYTKTGDNGKTSILGGGRILKSDIKVEAYGNVDELNSWLGYIISSLDDVHSKSILTDIQKILFTIGSSLALNDKKDGSIYNIPEITQYDINTLEYEIDEMTNQLKPLKNFILPGGNELISRIHISRTICRRAERSIVASKESDIFIITYINRLSDYLFTLARYIGYLNNIEEIKI